MSLAAFQGLHIVHEHIALVIECQVNKRLQQLAPVEVWDGKEIEEI